MCLNQGCQNEHTNVMTFYNTLKMCRLICPVYPTIQPTSSTRRIAMGDYDPKETEETEVPVEEKQ